MHNKYLILIFFSIPILGMAQSNPEFGSFKKEQLSKNIFQSISLSEDLNKHLENSIFVKQVGANNIVETAISAADYTLEIFQAGNSNYLLTSHEAEILDQSVRQVGTDNSIFSYGTNITGEIVHQISQTGSNLLYQSYGSNSIGKTMEVNMTGNDHTIIIRNYQ